MAADFTLTPVGRVASPLRDTATAPRQGDEGAPSAWLVFDSSYAAALSDIRPGDTMLLLTWLDRADRTVQAVHPRDDPARPLTGVFSTRSSDRPNPIGLHPVTILEADGLRLRADRLEAVDGTPILDLKPLLSPS
ncbi:tRNA (N6-threonylcarbamoyladenosine(37)-N6)-methyltransferase TrmO [Actinoplanes sp. OR16]|uniref:tRNA (N6-threonylcarbamoyladenosine(37)-N6)-methyltransferase TrmO n=1 Tax=Actinoplanes sp. OR16 TaxID=946334 RepID=UPI000F6B89F6|nr:tRNA (N6-threonylcarbamoyladenosine(37)-N6)-methyltransferase TrmO [Actinoplanes sp. OR16]BBH70277.1 tRNA (N6-threonylcarbamoyladenosine(37)-N6)-methyltransferase TrmO [Actinoplanes sp. OR16]